MSDQDEDFEAYVEDIAVKISGKFGQKVGDYMREVLLDQYTEIDEVSGDVEQADGQFKDSQTMDELISEHEMSEDVAENVFRVLEQIVNGEYHDDFTGAQLTPADIEWDISQEDIESAQQWIESLCHGGKFPLSENTNMYKTVAVGRKNQIELLTLMMDIYELARVDELVTPRANKRGFANNNITAWAAKTELRNTFSHDHTKTLQNAIAEYTKRISGGGPSQMVAHPIEDDINVYIEYTLLMSSIVHNLTKAEDEIVPFQIDFVILGKKHSTDDKKQAESDSDDDDDDEDAAAAFASGGALQNQLPEQGVAAILADRVEFEEDTISIDHKARTKRSILTLLKNKLSGQRNQRLIVVIDRSSNKDIADADDEKEEGGKDKLFVYQLEQESWARIESVDNELHMAWKTKQALMPSWKPSKGKEPSKDALVGGAEDIGDNNFVFSFHVHASNNVKCDQWIKAQKVPFLPYQMAAHWPMYFAKGHEEVNEKYSAEYLYKHFKVQQRDERLMKWIEQIDPVFYKRLQKKHIQHLQYAAQDEQDEPDEGNVDVEDDDKE